MENTEQEICSSLHKILDTTAFIEEEMYKNKTAEQFLKQLCQALRKTIDFYQIEKQERYFTRTELTIMSNLAETYQEIGEQNKAVNILHMGLRNIRRNPLENQICNHQQSLLLGTLATIIGNGQQMEFSVKIARKNIEWALVHDEMSGVEYDWYELAWNLREIGLRDGGKVQLEAAKEAFQIALSLAKLYGNYLYIRFLEQRKTRYE